jgi:AcrR family transcriptional regulator
MPSQAPAPQTKKKNRGEEILDAARELFFKQGYRGTSIFQIARLAGYSKRTVYLDYLNKDELFMTVCEEGGRLLLEKLRLIPHERLTVEEAVDRFMKVYVTFSRNHREYFRMIFSEATPEIISNCTEELRVRVGELERACLDVLVSWAERAMREQIIPEVDPWEVAGIVVGTATGIILLSMGGSQTVFSKKTLESLVHKAIWTLWRGLCISDAKAG